MSSVICVGCVDEPVPRPNAQKARSSASSGWSVHVVVRPKNVEIVPYMPVRLHYAGFGITAIGARPETSVESSKLSGNDVYNSRSIAIGAHKSYNLLRHDYRIEAPRMSARLSHAGLGFTSIDKCLTPSYEPSISSGGDDLTS